MEETVMLYIINNYKLNIMCMMQYSELAVS